MSIRMKTVLAVPLAALLAAGCTDDVTQEAAETFVRAQFDSTAGLIPTPNDLALQAAPSQTNPTTRAALFAIINNGGFEPTLATPGIGPLSAINIPYELVVEGSGGALPPPIDPTTITSSTVAIVRVSGAGAPEIIQPAFAGSTATATGRAFQVIPAVAPPAVWAAGTRYVVGVRGGASGVKTLDGRTLAPSSPMFLVTSGIDLSDAEARPPTVTAQQAADLLRLKGALTTPAGFPASTGLDWLPIIDNDATCRAALGIPAAAPFPEGDCWLPYVPPIPGAPGSPAARSAFAAVGSVFPITEAISLQTFETRP